MINMELDLISLKMANVLKDILVSFKHLFDAIFSCWYDRAFFGRVDV